jgi:hypothetical protein
VDATPEEFFHDFRQEMLADAEADGSFQLSAFMETVSDELVDTGFVDGFDLCHFRAQRGLRVDGYWFDDEGGLDLFVADFDCRSELASLTRTDAEAAFRRVASFFEACVRKDLAKELEVTSPEHGLARQIVDRVRGIRRLRLILVSERTLSDRLQSLPDGEVCGVPASYHIWDISRLLRQHNARGHKEALDLSFVDLFGAGIPCLPAHLGSGAYQSFLIVMPAEILATLYEKYGGQLLEQNVRCFLQARGKVNQGIRATILNEPAMFFAYNNGITATAQAVETDQVDGGLRITRIVDLQIVNGGQTTASLFHTRRRDKARLSGIFVQMKLSVIDSEESETLVPRISEYANTQNRVNAADFFSNHPFHIRMQEFSRRLWAPAQQGAQRETKWFYERARGQYSDAQSKMTPAEQRRFKAENPKPQMFNKTDLAKFENVWDEHPKWVNLGAQKNFARYAHRIGREWDKSSEGFNELYYKRAIARAITFRATEKLVSEQPWYNGGYRANIVAYTLATLGEIVRAAHRTINYLAIWNAQSINETFSQTLGILSQAVDDVIVRPPPGISNISEWCKKDACWTGLLGRLSEFEALIPQAFWDQLLSAEESAAQSQSAKKVQQIDDGIEAQRIVLAIAASEWAKVREVLLARRVLSPKEDGILTIAMQMPSTIPTEKQCLVLLEILEKAKLEGVPVP